MPPCNLQLKVPSSQQTLSPGSRVQLLVSWRCGWTLPEIDFQYQIHSEHILAAIGFVSSTDSDDLIVYSVTNLSC